MCGDRGRWKRLLGRALRLRFEISREPVRYLLLRIE